MIKSPLVSFLLASALAGAIWALSPWLTGHSEPWDASGILYSVALLLAGTVSGLLCAKPFWPLYIGSIVGQVLYCWLFLPSGPLAVLGLAFLIAWSVVFLVGGYLGLLLVTQVRSRPGAA